MLETNFCWICLHYTSEKKRCVMCPFIWGKWISPQVYKVCNGSSLTKKVINVRLFSVLSQDKVDMSRNNIELEWDAHCVIFFVSYVQVLVLYTFSCISLRQQNIMQSVQFKCIFNLTSEIDEFTHSDRLTLPIHRQSYDALIVIRK
jgi:hypothetical protein